MHIAWPNCRDMMFADRSCRSTASPNAGFGDSEPCDEDMAISHC